MPPPILIYTTYTCIYCRLAKRLLAHKGLEYEEIDVTADRETRTWPSQTTGQHTVPQIFVGETSVGGYTELSAIERTGELDRLLRD